MRIVRNHKRCMSICNIKRELTNEYRLIAQWASKLSLYRISLLCAGLCTSYVYHIFNERDFGSYLQFRTDYAGKHSFHAVYDFDSSIYYHDIR